MRALAICFLALGIVIGPATVRTMGADDGTGKAAPAPSNDTSAKANVGDTTAAPAKNDTPAKPAASALENELQQLRDLLEAQARQLQLQNDELKAQREKMESLEAELKTVNVSTSAAVSTSALAAAPAVAGNAANNTGAFSYVENPQRKDDDASVSIRFKGITITPGGFLAAETVFRNKAIGADINTPFNSVPFPGNANSQTTEFNATGRQSRISMLAEGKLDSTKLSGYVETDFLSAAITSNNNESNSYALRVRQAWGQAKMDNGWSFTGGQQWSLVTETKHGVDNRTEAVPLTIDPQYTVGFSWARQYGFRVAKSFGDMLTVAASVENAATTLTAHGQSNNFVIGSYGVSSGLYNPIANYAYNKLPDFVFKAALDPHFGHFEVFGLVSTFRDRIYPCATASSTAPCALDTTIVAPSAAFAGNDGRVGGGIGANARVSLLDKKLDLGLHFFGGDGIGRYGTGSLSDVTVRPDGTLALIRNYQVLGKIEVHPMPKLDVYAYVGGEYEQRTAYLNSAGKGVGYGSPLLTNSGCDTETLPGSATSTPNGVGGSAGFIPGALANCTGDTRNLIEGTFGFWYRVYAGPKGRIQWGPQYSYIVRNTWYGTGATTGTFTAPHGIDNMFFTSFRYYLP
jgi:hypothetical protein